MLSFNEERGASMADEVKVILELSNDVETLLEEQGVDLYLELQRTMPSLRVEKQIGTEAPFGIKGDITTVLLATSTLVSSLTPLIIRILNQFTPPNRSAHWEIDETETRHLDGTVIIQRKRVRSSDEQRPWTALPYPDNQPPAPPRNQ